jgi:hypothetical protein
LQTAAKVVAVLSLIYAIVTINILGFVFNIVLVVCVFSDRPQRGMALAFIIWQVVGYFKLENNFETVVHKIPC